MHWRQPAWGWHSLHSKDCSELTGSLLTDRNDLVEVHCSQIRHMKAQDVQKWCFHYHIQHFPYGLLLRVGKKLRCSEASSILHDNYLHNHRPKAGFYNQHPYKSVPQGLFSYISGQPVRFPEKEPWEKVYRCWTKISTLKKKTSKLFP